MLCVRVRARVLSAPLAAAGAVAGAAALTATQAAASGYCSGSVDYVDDYSLAHYNTRWQWQRVQSQHCSRVSHGKPTAP